MITARTLLVVLISLFGNYLTAQIRLVDFTSGEVGQRKMRKYVESFHKGTLVNFCDLQSSINNGFSENQYSFHEGTCVVDAPLLKLWETCLSANPAEIWQGKILSLSFIYNKKTEKLVFKPDFANCKLKLDQIYFINLRLLKGIFNLPTALKVTRIDSVQNSIEFNYLKGGKLEGRQVLRFTKESESRTRIVHTTYYRSNSKLRDKRFYPHFHEMAITELHKNLEKKAMQ